MGTFWEKLFAISASEQPEAFIIRFRSLQRRAWSMAMSITFWSVSFENGGCLRVRTSFQKAFCRFWPRCSTIASSA